MACFLAGNDQEKRAVTHSRAKEDIRCKQQVNL